MVNTYLVLFRTILEPTGEDRPSSPFNFDGVGVIDEASVGNCSGEAAADGLELLCLSLVGQLEQREDFPIGADKGL
jgi:hypothetical protein